MSVEALATARCVTVRRRRPWRWALIPAVAGIVLVASAPVGAPSLIGEREPVQLGTEAVLDVVRRYDAALVSHDWNALERLIAEDFTFHYTKYGAMQSRRGFLAWAHAMTDAHPDFLVSPDRVLVDRDFASVRFHERHATGAVPRSGIGSSGVVWLRIVQGSIVEMWSNYDEFGMLRETA